MRSRASGNMLKEGILLFWSVWTGIVVAMNVGNILKVLGILAPDSKLASGNYEAIDKATSEYDPPEPAKLLMLLGATVWEAISMAFFWDAIRRWRAGSQRRFIAVDRAFTTLLDLFGAFILTDEVLHDFKDERDHRSIAALLLSSLTAMHLLPDRRRER